MNKEHKHILGRVQITRKCNQRCVFCSAPPAKKELGIEEIKKRIVKLKRLGTTDLMLTGGEPTLKENLLEILEFADGLGFNEITIQTNGSRLDNKDLVKELKRIRNLRFDVSFHSSDRKIFEKISRTPENYDRLLRGLRNIGELDIPAYLTVVISKLNYKTLKDHVRFIKENYPKITHISFNFIDPIYNAEKNPWTVPKLSEAEMYIYEAVRFMKENGITFRIEKLPLCYMSGFEEFSSDIRRDILDEHRIMSFLRSEEDLTDEELNIEKKTKFIYAPDCRYCFLKSLCPGINPNYARIHGYSEVYPVFEDIRKIAQRVKESRAILGSRETGYINEHIFSSRPPKDLKGRITDDLRLFEYAIRTKSNKNNIYDTYSFFLIDPIGFKEEDFIYKSWREHTEKIREGKRTNLLNFYIHIPFCRSNCSYCVYPSTTLQNERGLEDYLEFLSSKMKKFHSLFKGLKFKTLYIGGGTPSIFSEKQLDRLLGTLFSLFEFDGDAEKAIEFNPSTTTLAKLKTLEKYGFNKLSMGVQSLSKHVLELNKREYQTREMIENAIKWFKRLDLNYINLDLILGLKGDTVPDFVHSFRELCRMGPNNICIYPIKTNDRYIKNNYGTFNNFKEFYYPLFKGAVKEIIPISDKYRYEARFDPGKLSYIAPLIFSRKGQRTKNIGYSYSHFSKEPFSNFCLGYYSHSRISEVIDYRYIDRNNSDSMFLKKFSTNPKDYVYAVDGFSPIFEKVKFIVLEFYKKREISRKTYKGMFESDIVDDFPYAIKALKMLGVITITDEKIIFRRMDETQAYKHMLFFTGRENVLKRIKVQYDD